MNIYEVNRVQEKTKYVRRRLSLFVGLCRRY